MEKLDLQKELDLLLAERLISGFINYDNCIDWAVSLMQRGYETENLYILAGLDNNDGISIEHYFEKLIDDLQLIRNDNKEELFYLYTSNTARLVIEKEIEPQKGLRMMEEIWLQTIDADLSNIELIQFSYLAEDISLIGEYQLIYTGLTKDNIDGVIIEEMRMFLLIENRKLSNISNLIYCNRCKSVSQSVYKEKGWFVKHGRWYCKECNSKDYLAWCNVDDRIRILEILKNEEQTI